MPSLGPLDHVALHVRDLDASIRWYTDVLGLVRLYEDQWGGVPSILVDAGSGSGVALFPVEADAGANTTDGRIAIDHFAFRVTPDDIEVWSQHLGALGEDVERKQHGVCESLYLHDPDGHIVEITAYRGT